MSDKIIVKGLKCYANIGCTEAERAKSQKLAIDIEMYLPLAPAGHSADLTKTVCYHTVSNDVSALLQSQHWVLIEQLAEKISELILNKYQLVRALKIEVRKFVLPEVDYASVEINRSR